MSIYTRMSVLLFIWAVSASICFSAPNYNIGNPVLTDLWVDPVHGNDSNSGATQNQAVKTLTAAWNRTGPFTATGYRINLLPGIYPCEPGPEDTNCINYFADRAGTYQFPLILKAHEGPHSVTIRGGFNFDDVHYLYLIDLDLAGGMPLPTNSSGNNLLHLANSDHVLLRGMSITGPACDRDSCNNLQEVLKVNQTQYLYVENSTIGGAWHSSVDYMVVQYGHFLNNRVHTAGQWCMYIKGGSSYLHIEGNEFGDATQRCQLGFQAGQSANFAMMQPPWLHYEAYDIKFVNNLLHDIPGVGMSVSGGYNILFAYNTLYRVGTSVDPGYGLMHFIYGERNCTPTDELPKPVNQCKDYANQGGWGPTVQVDSVPAIPNRNVYVYNNLFYNPAPEETAYIQFELPGPIDRPKGFQNSPDPARADDHLVIRGNLIWNGPVNHPLGVEEADRGCQPSNPTCNQSQLQSDNTINLLEPQLVNPGGDDLRPVPGGNVFNVATYPIPDFTWDDAPSRPAVPQGNLTNKVAFDRDQNPRSSSGPPGAYAGGTAPPALFSLTVTKGGSGKGSVVSAPPGINCDANCLSSSFSYSSDTSVTLTATPSTESTFTGWSGDCSGAGPCAVTMSQNRTVAAVFQSSIPETVSAPDTPTGPAKGQTGASYAFTTDGSISNLGHAVEYQFDWKGDASDLSSWGASTQSKAWTVPGAYHVRARARCSADRSVISTWSSSLPVGISVPEISVIPAAYDFGDVKVKRSKAGSFTVKNNGTANLSITSTIAGTDASMFATSGSGSKTLKPGKTLTIKVTFKPTSTGPRSATLRITSNDPVTPIVDAALSGRGQ